MNHKITYTTTGMDILTKDVLFVLGGLFLVLLVWWHIRIAMLVGVFLRASREVLGTKVEIASRLLPYYRKEELKGSYKGRLVSVGALYSGLQGEFLPLPYIRMRLKESVGYNTNRLPYYATIEKNFLVYQPKLTLLWGVIDKNFVPVFSKSYLIVALERLLATAEDVERGRTLNEIFK